MAISISNLSNTYTFAVYIAKIKLVPNDLLCMTYGSTYGIKISFGIGNYKKFCHAAMKFT